MGQGKSLCKECKHKFRRVFIPLNPEDYTDEDGNRVLTQDDNIMILNTCLISNMDVDGEVTVECDHFEQRKEKDSFPFFKHDLK